VSYLLDLDQLTIAVLFSDGYDVAGVDEVMLGFEQLKLDFPAGEEGVKKGI
jgi:hypothetical protein